MLMNGTAPARSAARNPRNQTGPSLAHENGRPVAMAIGPDTCRAVTAAPSTMSRLVICSDLVGEMFQVSRKRSAAPPPAGSVAYHRVDIRLHRRTWRQCGSTTLPCLRFSRYPGATSRSSVDCHCVSHTETMPEHYRLAFAAPRTVVTNHVLVGHDDGLAVDGEHHITAAFSPARAAGSARAAFSDFADKNLGRDLQQWRQTDFAARRPGPASSAAMTLRSSCRTAGRTISACRGILTSIRMRQIKRR